MSPTFEVAQLAQQAADVLKPYLPTLATSAATAVGEAGREALEDVAAAPVNTTYITVLQVQVQKALERNTALLTEYY